MEVRAQVSRAHAFVLREQSIRKIWGVLEEHVGTVAATARCTDELVRTFSSVEDLLNYENATSKRILSLRLDAQSNDGKISAELAFAEHSWGTIELAVRGDEFAVSRLKDQLDDVFEGLRPWYWRFSRLDFFYIIGGAVLFAYVLLNAYALGKPRSEFEMSWSRALLMTLVTISIFAAIGFVIFGLNQLSRRYFPLAMFATGQGQARYAQDETVRWAIFVGFVISLAASLVAFTLTMWAV